MFFLTVLLALALHTCVTLALALKFLGGFHRAALSGDGAGVTHGFSTASSSATLPLTMEAVEERAKVSNKTRSFTLLLGAINMDGTALYACVATFIAQLYAATGRSA